MAEASQHYAVAEPESLFSRLKLMPACPICNSGYSGNAVHILEAQAFGHLVHVTCAECRSTLLSLVVQSSIGMSSVSVMTDLTVVDVVLMRQRAAVSEDDLLNFCAFLNRKQQFENLLISN